MQSVLSSEAAKDSFCCSVFVGVVWGSLVAWLVLLLLLLLWHVQVVVEGGGGAEVRFSFSLLDFAFWNSFAEEGGEVAMVDVPSESFS